MWAKIAAAFALGFATGILCLSIGLWRTGSLRTGGITKQPVSLAAPAKGTSRPPGGQAPPAPSSLSAVQPRRPEAQGEAKRAAPEADRAAPEANPGSPEEERAAPEANRAAPEAGTMPRVEPLPHLEPMPLLEMPVPGVAKNDLVDTFNQTRNGHKHEALDIPAPRGTPVKAAAEGNVVKLFNSKQGGLTVYQFDDSRTYCYYYAHLDRYAPGLKEGTLLRTGDVLGSVGSTGNASADAPHLHFAVFVLGPEKKWWKGTAVDPLPLLR